MSSIHYFQRYSQPENVATNNTLLLLSRLYNYSPNKFNGFLSELLNDANLESGVIFNQQKRGKTSIPDGCIYQSSFKILIETKLYDKFEISQLNEHLNSFESEEYKVLLLLSTSEPDQLIKRKIEEIIVEYNKNNGKNIKFISTTFQNIVSKYRNCLEDYDYKLQEVVDDYESYCIECSLITNNDSRMRVVACGWTSELNFRYNLYFDPIERGYSAHKFFGIYKEKKVIGVGKLENVIFANLIDDNELNILECTSPVTMLQKENIIGVIRSVQNENNWDISQNHKFFCVDKFYKTNFVKETKYPIQRSKFFDLKELLEINEIPDTETIARLLIEKSW